VGGRNDSGAVIDKGNHGARSKPNRRPKGGGGIAGRTSPVSSSHQLTAGGNDGEALSDGVGSGEQGFDRDGLGPTSFLGARSTYAHRNRISPKSNSPRDLH